MNDRTLLSLFSSRCTHSLVITYTAVWMCSIEAIDQRGLGRRHQLQPCLHAGKTDFSYSAIHVCNRRRRPRPPQSSDKQTRDVESLEHRRRRPQHHHHLSLQSVRQSAMIDLPVYHLPSLLPSLPFHLDNYLRPEPFIHSRSLIRSRAPPRWCGKGNQGHVTSGTRGKKHNALLDSLPMSRSLEAY